MATTKKAAPKKAAPPKTATKQKASVKATAVKSASKKASAESAEVKQPVPFVEPEMDFKLVPLKNIIPDPKQPRQYYDEHAQQELTDSIRESGVLQPILLRPASNGKLMIVYGERRFRASTAIQVAFKSRDSIPAIIREMSDEEALQAQITENLQRKNVKPMEEAVAFKSLQDMKKMDVKDIGLLVGKSPSFVAQRIQLNNLLADFQEMLSRNMMDLSSAYQLARVSEDLQNSILKERTAHYKDWRKSESFRLSNVDYYLNNKRCSLSNPPFKTIDKDLYPEAGACTLCPHNTSTQPLLFEDEKGKYCTSPSCFAIKVERAFKQKAEKVLQDPNIIPVLERSYNGGSEDQSRINTFIEAGVTPLEYDKYIIAKPPSEPQNPGTFEEFLEDGHFDPEEDDRDEWKSDYENDLVYYQNALREYEAELEIYNAAKKEGFKKGYIVCGYNDAGKTVDIILKKAGKAAVESGIDIGAMLAREERKKETDQESIMKRMHEAMKADSVFKTDDTAPTGATLIAGCLLLFSVINYPFEDDLRKDLGLPVHGDYNLMKAYEAFKEHKEPVALFNKLLRVAILSKFIETSLISPYSQGKAKAFYAVAKEALPDQVSIFEQEQAEKAEKRLGNLNKRIAALERKASKAKSSQEAPAE